MTAKTAVGAGRSCNLPLKKPSIIIQLVCLKDPRRDRFGDLGSLEEMRVCLR